MPANYDDEEAQRREQETPGDIEERHIWGTGDPNSGIASEFDEGSADIPIWGWLSGASARRDAARNRGEQKDAEAAWQQLLRFDAPSANDLTPHYYLEDSGDVYGDLLGGRSALEDVDSRGSASQQAAMAALYDLYRSGGYTDADRQAAAMQRRAAAMELGQQLRGANEAALQQMGARGMGGSGQELAARLAGSQAMVQGQAGYDANVNAAMMQAAQQRALASLQGYGSMAAQQQSQELARRQALDAYNQSNLDWRRGRESRNTDLANRQQDARVAGRQTAYSNLEHGVAGLTNQYQGAQSNRRQDAARQDQANQAGAGAIGTLISEIL